MFCTKCGKPNDDAASFCASCGYVLPFTEANSIPMHKSRLLQAMKSITKRSWVPRTRTIIWITLRVLTTREE